MTGWKQPLGAVLCLAAVLAVLGGCDRSGRTQPGVAEPAGAGATAASAPDKALDPCTLVTPEEIAAALTQPADTPESDDRGVASSCTVWSHSRDRYLVVMLLAPGFDGTPGFGWTRPEFDEVCAGYKTNRAVSGLGDAACFTLTKESATIEVLHGSFAFSCHLAFDRAEQRLAEDAMLSTLRTLAVAILSRR